MQIDQLDHQNSCTKVRYELFLHESWSSLFMLHHLPEDLNRQGLSEIARVLKPGGRLLVLDLKGPTANGRVALPISLPS